jgi:hypothetical protein
MQKRVYTSSTVYTENVITDPLNLIKVEMLYKSLTLTDNVITSVIEYKKENPYLICSKTSSGYTSCTKFTGIICDDDELYFYIKGIRYKPNRDLDGLLRLVRY